MSKYKELFLPQVDKALNQKYADLLDQSSHDGKRCLYELFSLTIHHELSIDSFFSIFDMLYSNNSEYITNILVDLLWLIGFPFSQEKDDKKSKEYDTEIKIYSQIINTFLSKKLITSTSLIEKLEVTTLSQCGIVPDLNSFRSKITCINTKNNYEQKKYNLLREESEGFSKLICIFFSFGDMIIQSKEEMELVLDKIICLIGFFDLDPTRVVDLGIEAFIAFPFNTNFLWIFNILNLKALPHVIGCKLTKTVIKKSLYIVISQFIKYGFVSIEDIVHRLKPSFGDMEKAYLSNIDKIMAYSKTGFIEKIASELRANNALSMNIDDSNISPNFSKQTANNFCNFNEIVAEAITYEDNNQLLELFDGLIQVKDKQHMEMLFDIFQDYYDPLQSRILNTSLCNLVSWMIDGLYSQYATSLKYYQTNQDISNDNQVNSLIFPIKEKESFKQFSSFDEMIMNITNTIKILSLGLSTNQIVFQKLLLIISKQSQQTIFLHENKIIRLITDHFFPSLSLIDPTPSLVNLLWAILSHFDYNKRYQMYNEWYSKTYTSHPLLYLKYHVVNREIGKWQKALSKENQRQHGRILGIISNSNPILVFDNIIRLLTSYENQIGVFIQTLSFCSSLSYDVITFIICKIIADPTREKIDTSSCSINIWFKNFVFFIGCFYKKYHTAEINGLLIYIIGKFKQETIGIEIYTLKELIEKMSGIQTQEQLSESHFLAECGGIHLYLESINLGKDYKYFKRPTQILNKFFTQGLAIHTKNENISFTLALLSLFIIKRKRIIYSSNETSVKLISFLYDQFQYIFIQLITFLRFYSDKDFFNRLFTNLNPEIFINHYYFSPINVFQLTRSTFKPLYEQTDEEYQTNILFFTNIFDKHQLKLQKSLKDEITSSYIETNTFINDIYKSIWNYISPELYYIFNVLELKDIFFPMKRYEAELEKNIKEKEKIIQNINDETDSKTKKELEKVMSTIENLHKEIKQYKSHSVDILNFLSKKTTMLDSIQQTNKKEIPQYLMQYLLYPRLILSKADAIYTAQLLSILVMLKIPMLNVLDLVRKLLQCIIPCISCVSECEALNIGYFLNEFLKSIKMWQEEKYWHEKCSSNPCFSRSLEIIQTVELCHFKKAIECILSKMNVTFQNIFNSDDYMNCRNAVSVLSQIALYHPVTKESASELITMISKSYLKFTEYEDSIFMKRYKDNLTIKLDILPNENELVNSNTVNIIKVPVNEKPEKSHSIEKNKKKKDRSRDKDYNRDREKKKEESNRSNDIRRKSPEDYSRKKNRNNL